MGFIQWNVLRRRDFMSSLLRNPLDPYDISGSSNFSNSSSFWPDQKSINLAVSAWTDDSEIDASRGNDILFPFSSYETYYPMGMDYRLKESKNDYSRCHSLIYNNVTEGDHGFLYQETSRDSIGLNENQPEPSMSEPSEQDRFSSPRESSKKRHRMPTEAHKNKRNIKMKTLDDNNDNNIVLVRHNTSSCSTKDDSASGSHELNGGLASSSDSKGSGKTRATRGAATDPQSLYARKRREKINERLRVLQGLVPNGTKVDISTMLEEAVEYVKFLQLQIKLLSSDELWMYAPVAYNGMDIGQLDLRIKASKPQES
ncbi:uncharacterized protein LOC142544854 [Primulina tabacum]|uniref:uncharacterized protein LOC142544854 n=1 Tax=Primulina tabacum TaxID=48773 RepID=UPI003F5A2E3E